MTENLDVKPPAGYAIVRLLGRGGMGTVVQARQVETGRLVALKYLHLTVGNLRERFLREGRLASELVHPNIVQGLGIEFVDDAPALVFEFVEGTDLRTYVEQRQKLAVSEALELVRPILSALGYAHERGIVHRDLKSANVMVTAQGVPKLADFGTAHVREAHEKLTQTGMILGTPAYMAPEQASGLGIDGRADLYSLGVMLFEMLSGRVPFSGANPMALLLVVQKEAPPRLDELVPEVPRHIADVVDCCLAKKPEHRYPTAAALLAALESRGPASRSVKTLRQIAVLEPQPVGSSTLEGEPVAPPSLPRLTTGRVRTLGVSAVATTPPPAGLPRWALAVGALLLLALGAAGAHFAMKPLPLTVLNDKAGGFLTRLDGRPAFVFQTDMQDPLRATLLAGGKEIALDALPAHTSGEVHAFAAPAEKLVDTFYVRLSRADGRPVQASLLNHPGLWSIVEEWDRRLDVVDSKPEPRDVWPELLDRLAVAVGVTDGGTHFLGMATGRGEPTKDELRHLEEVAKRAAAMLQPLLVAAAAVLDLPLSAMPLPKKKRAYHALLPARILDRALHSAGLGNLMLGAEKALGRRFATVEATKSRLRVIYQHQLPKVSLTSAGTLTRGGEDSNFIAGALGNTALADKREIVSHQAVLKLPAAAPGQAARIDFYFRIFKGVPEPLPSDELVFVELLDEKWLLLLHAGSRGAEGDDLSESHRAIHRLEPELLKPRTLLRFTREVLRSRVNGDRRESAVWLLRLFVRVGEER